MNFSKYMHVERFGNEEVEGVELGKCYVFPKIDGTNASVWLEDGCMAFGSRNRKLSPQSDNHCFVGANLLNVELSEFFKAYPTHRLFGEWLVPHTLKTYRDDAWNKFYIFDVCTVDGDGHEYFLPYEDYQPILEKFKLDYLRPQVVVTQPTLEQLTRELEKNTFLIKDGCGFGEGIVIKNYGFYNKFNRQVWAKIVRNEFKEQNRDAFGVNILKGDKIIETEIVETFVTETLIEKTYAKLLNDEGSWSNKLIPRLLETVFYEVIKEETWEFLKKYKNPVINFKTLKSLTMEKVKHVKADLFTGGKKA